MSWTWAAMVLMGGGQIMGQEAPYEVGAWAEAGRGNHRAIVRVTDAADAVWAHIPWRRRDDAPEAKAVRVCDVTSGKQVRNVICVDVSPESGDLVFQPSTAPGDYEIYYLPYTPGVGNFDDPGTYFPAENTAEPAWIERHGLGAEKIQTGDWKALPRATLVQIQSRSEFDRMDPMEVIATDDEKARLLAAHPGRSYLLFPEDRRYPIRMFETIPSRWIQTGPAAEFVGDAQPGEFFPFQLGIWAARQSISDVSLRLTDLKNDAGQTLPGSGMTCFNLTGTDWLGRPMVRTFQVGQGSVRPLWIGLQVPQDASGTFRGSVTVQPEGAEPTEVNVVLRVSGPVLDDGGVGDLWRMSRLKWLNSTLGLDDEVLPPYTPLKRKGNEIECLDRTVRFEPLGFPEAISSRGVAILSDPMAFIVDSAAGPLRFRANSPKIAKETPGAIESTTQSHAGRVTLITESRMEFDGCLFFVARLRSDEDLDLKDVRLEIPMDQDVAAYMMGLGLRGGARPESWRWKWNIDRADNQVWLGNGDAGLQLHLRGAKDVWDMVTLRDAGLPPSWHNDGQGGCDVLQEKGRVVVRAFSGARTLQAGQDLEFRFRLLITPFRPIDPNHWNWRYGDLNAGGNILHIHHGCPENPYINYPFLHADRLAQTIREAKSHVKVADFGKLSYPASGQIDLERGALHLWVFLRFDPQAGQARDSRFNQNLFNLEFPNEDSFSLYWNVDVRGMRAYVRKGAPQLNVYPSMVDASAPEWHQGERHLLSLSWGEELTIYVDGVLRGQGPFSGLSTADLSQASLTFAGEGFGLEGIKIEDIPFKGEAPPQRTPDGHALLLDDFTSMTERGTSPNRISPGCSGLIIGAVERVLDPGAGPRLSFSSRVVSSESPGVNLYYTVRELSNHAVEMWPLRSLGDEIFQTRETFIFSVDKTFFGQAGGGYPWLQEHLKAGYVPAWRQPLWDGDHDAAIGTQGLSRWHNYYVEGMQWLMQNTGLDGLYLDGIGYDREIMKRIAKVMSRNTPRYRINFHSGNNYDFMDWHTSPANTYMEHLPYVSNLWFGEMYDYNRSPDYWFVEISGIPFGLTSEMLEYGSGGNPYRGMIYGMTGRIHPSAPAMWQFWDDFGIQDAEWIGYWSGRCPVKTDHSGVLVSAYRKKEKSLIALAHWPGLGPDEASQTGSIPVRLSIDWKALGLSPSRSQLIAPAIDHFQTSARFLPSEEIPVEPGKGWLLVLSEGEK